MAGLAISPRMPVWRPETIEYGSATSASSRSRGSRQLHNMYDPEAGRKSTSSPGKNLPSAALMPATKRSRIDETPTEKYTLKQGECMEPAATRR